MKDVLVFRDRKSGNKALNENEMVVQVMEKRSPGVGEGTAFSRAFLFLVGVEKRLFMGFLDTISWVVE